MAELRRVLIDPLRMSSVKSPDRRIKLNQQELHYLKRVLRMKKDQSFVVVDGAGHMWEASLKDGHEIFLKSSLETPLDDSPRPTPLICLAVVVPRNGFEEVLRMGCELGVDLIQPLRSNRANPYFEDKNSRWKSILRESVEQCERLWLPQLKPVIQASDLWKRCNFRQGFFYATTRVDGLIGLNQILQKMKHDLDEVWVAIGPEGGWTPQEECSANAAGWVGVHLSNNILRTSTASVVASQIMASWRKEMFLSV